MSRVGGDPISFISTYFSVLYIKQLIKKVELQGFNLETSPNSFIAEKRNLAKEILYSKLEFCNEEEEDNYYEEAGGY